MVTTHNLGFPFIGAQRELINSRAAYWTGSATLDELESVAHALREKNWLIQSGIDWVPVGDFCLSERVLETSLMVGNYPRVRGDRTLHPVDTLLYIEKDMDNSFGCRRNHGFASFGCTNKRWFSPRQRYIAPELSCCTDFHANPANLVAHLKEAQQLGVNTKPVIIGPLTYLALGTILDQTDPLDLLNKLTRVYAELLNSLAALNVEWVQIDEPILTMPLNQRWRGAFNRAYHLLAQAPIKILLATYFGPIGSNRCLLANLPVAGIHVDITNGTEDLQSLLRLIRKDLIVSIGFIDGRKIWKTDLVRALDILEPLFQKLGDRLWIAPSCSLVHVPVDVDSAYQMSSEIKLWVAFAKQKLAEVEIVALALNHGRRTINDILRMNQAELSVPVIALDEMDCVR